MLCRDGEIGRRKGLKIPRWKHHVGSSPIRGTKKAKIFFRFFLLHSSAKIILKSIIYDVIMNNQLKSQSNFLLEGR